MGSGLAGKELGRERAIGVRAGRGGVVVQNGLGMGRGLGDADFAAILEVVEAMAGFRL